MLDLDAIEARAEAATPGPWHTQVTTACFDVIQGGDRHTDNRYISMMGVDSDPDGDFRDYSESNADADFIAYARTDIPALVAELRAAREVVEAAQANADTWDEHYHQRPVDRNLVAALAAYRTVVGEQP